MKTRKQPCLSLIMTGFDYSFDIFMLAGFVPKRYYLENLRQYYACNPSILALLI
jgi:hypothetical protein